MISLYQSGNIASAVVTAVVVVAAASAVAAAAVVVDAAVAADVAADADVVANLAAIAVAIATTWKQSYCVSSWSCSSSTRSVLLWLMLLQWLLICHPNANSRDDQPFQCGADFRRQNL